jgi:hypothetical protein
MGINSGDTFIVDGITYIANNDIEVNAIKLNEKTFDEQIDDIRDEYLKEYYKFFELADRETDEEKAREMVKNAQLYLDENNSFERIRRVYNFFEGTGIVSVNAGE